MAARQVASLHMHNQYQPEAARTCGPMHNERRRMLVNLNEAPQLQGIQLLVVRVNRIHSSFYELRERGVIGWLACAHCEVLLVPLRHNLSALGTPAVDDERAKFLSGFVLLLDLLLRLIRLCCTGYAGCQMPANRSWLLRLISLCCTGCAGVSDASQSQLAGHSAVHALTLEAPGLAHRALVLVQRPFCWWCPLLWRRSCGLQSGGSDSNS